MRIDATTALPEFPEVGAMQGLPRRVDPPLLSDAPRLKGSNLNGHDKITSHQLFYRFQLETYI